VARKFLPSENGSRRRERKMGHKRKAPCPTNEKEVGGGSLFRAMEEQKKEAFNNLNIPNLGEKGAAPLLK